MRYCLKATSANVSDVTMTSELMHGEEDTLNGDSGYLGAEKREDAKVRNKSGKKIRYEINRRPSQMRKLSKSGQYKAKKREHAKSSVRAKVEHVFGVVKGLLKFKKTRYQGLLKQEAKFNIMFALANLILADRPCLAVFFGLPRIKNIGASSAFCRYKESSVLALRIVRCCHRRFPARIDYTAVQEKLAELEDKARRLKHAINVFNISQTIDDSGMTIDQALVYIPQLSERKRKLAIMRAAQKKKRNESMKSSNLIEYTYANYDIEQAEADYQSTSDELARVQNALDLINSTVQFEIDI